MPADFDRTLGFISRQYGQVTDVRVLADGFSRPRRLIARVLWTVPLRYLTGLFAMNPFTTVQFSVQPASPADVTRAQRLVQRVPSPDESAE